MKSNKTCCQKCQLLSEFDVSVQLCRMLTCKQSHEIRENKYVDFIKLQGSTGNPSFKFLIKQKGEYGLRKGCSY